MNHQEMCTYTYDEPSIWTRVRVNPCKSDDIFPVHSSVIIRYEPNPPDAFVCNQIALCSNCWTPALRGAYGFDQWGGGSGGTARLVVKL